MSRIYFHTLETTVRVSGVERAHFGNLINDIALAFIRPSSSFDVSRKTALYRSSPPWLQIQGENLDFERLFRVYWRTADEPLRLPDDRQVDPWTVSLNTVIALGSPSLILAARIHGQCELHGYVESYNVGWFRGLIETGLASGVFRPGEGWDDLIEVIDRQWPTVIRAPIVMSYIVCDTFPNPEIAGWLDGRDEEEDNDHVYGEFGNLPDEEQWMLSIRGLRNRDETYRLEMKPDDWNSYRFGDGMTAMELRETLDELDRR